MIAIIIKPTIIHEVKSIFCNSDITSLSTLTNTVNSIATNLEDMERKNNETKVKELKDTLINYYNKYRVVGEWSNLEKEAFWELFEDYESRGGNGFIHSIVEPVMRELKVVD